MKKIRVGVLMGGKSIEREVSFNSGRTVCDHLDTSRYDIVPLFQTAQGALYLLPWHFLHRGKTTDFVHRLSEQAQKIKWDDLKSLIDFVYIATHGRYAEDGTMQGVLEILGIPYLGPRVFASALSMDKIIQKLFLKKAGIPVPRDIVIQAYEYPLLTLEQIKTKLTCAGLSFPLVIKPYKEGSSLGITVVHNEEQLLPAIEQAATVFPGIMQSVLIEEKIRGMEFSCIILEDYRNNCPLPLPPTEIVPEQGTEFFDYEQKYMPGRALKFTPARCSAEIIKKIQQVCIATMETLEIRTIARIDGFVTPDDEVIIIDPNILSGMGPTSFLYRQAAEINMSHTQLINHLIETELHAYGMLDAVEKKEQESMNEINTERIKVAVLLAGASNEKEISLESGRNIVYKLSPQKYEAIPIFVSDSLELYKINQSLLVRNSTKEIQQQLDSSMRIAWNDLPTVADFVFIALHGGEGENGCVQGMLEMLDLPYNGSGVLTSALCMDKYKTTQFLKEYGFDVPSSFLVKKDNWLQEEKWCLTEIEKQLTFPLIVKPSDDGCSVMVQKVTTIAQLQDAITNIFNANKTTALVEECVIGMELTVGVLGNKKPHALPPSQAVSCSGVLSIEEKFLPGAGENQTPAPLPADALMLVKSVMERAYQVLDCKGYARIDCFYQSPDQSSTGKERVVILEINTLPGMTPATCIFHQAAELNIRPMDFIDKIIQLGMELHTKQLQSKITHHKPISLS